MSLALKAARGAIFSVISGVGSRAIGLISTLVLTRFIAPAEYGAVSVATVIVLTASDLTTFGLFHWVMAHPEAPRSTIFHATFYHILLGLLAIGIIMGWRTELGMAMKSPLSIAFMPGLVISAMLERIAFPAERMLVRDLRFGELAIVRGVAEMLYAGVSIVFAVAGFGGMSIVYGNIVQWGVIFLSVAYLANWRDWIKPAKLTWGETRSLFGFGLPMTIGHIAHNAAKKWDNLLISRYFGEATVGRYNLAYNLADIPATHVGEQIAEVLLPSFARLDPEARGDALIRATRLLGIIVFPMAVGLAAVATTATGAIFDARWAEMAPMLMLLSALSVVRPIGWAIGSYQIAERQPLTVMSLEVAKVVVLLGMVVLLAPHGVLWACLAPAFAFACHTIGSMLAVRISRGVSFLRLGGGVLPPLFATVPMAAAVFGVRYLTGLAGWGANVFTLALEVIVGGVVFIPSALILSPSTSRDLLDTTKRALQRRRGGGDEEPTAGDAPAAGDAPTTGDAPEDEKKE